MNYTLFPIAPNETHLFKMYKQAVGSFWTTEEVEFAKDLDDWNSLSKNEQFFLKHILAFFAGSDGIVQENLATRFQREVPSMVARLFYGFQNAIEGIHSEMYSLLIDTYIQDPVEKTHLFQSIDTIPTIANKAAWALKHIESSASFQERLVAFACVEGIFFSGAFCSIFWIKNRGLLKGLTFSNELISRDEALHTLFAIEMYKTLPPLSEALVYEIVRESVAIEKEFICDALSCSLVGMNASLMSIYIEFVADRLLQQLGVPKFYKSANPFDFMDMISLEGKGNFFERKISAYSKTGVGKSAEEMVIRTDLLDF